MKRASEHTWPLSLPSCLSSMRPRILRPTATFVHTLDQLPRYTIEWEALRAIHILASGAPATSALEAPAPWCVVGRYQAHHRRRSTAAGGRSVVERRRPPERARARAGGRARTRVLFTLVAW